MNSDNKSLFYNAAINGELNILKNIMHVHRNIINMADINHVFLLACKHGHLDVFKWLYLSVSCYIDINARDDYAFRLACENGHLDMAKWMYLAKLNINISAVNEYAFRETCKNGHVNVAEWLCELNPLKYHVEIVNNQIINWYIKTTIIINQTKQIYVTKPIKCPICIDEDVKIQTNCEHSYCLNCISEWHNKSNTCPLCRQQLNDFYQIVQKIE
jgi:ankyrin repeat protein